MLKKIFSVALCTHLIILAAVLGICYGAAVKLGKQGGAVVTNGPHCAEIGAEILRKGGHAVDAAIAAGICEGTVMSQSMGIGGGFSMTIYDHKTRKVTTINAREKAPQAATEDMFLKKEISGGLAVAVPGELRGYELAYTKFGRLEWAELINPTIELCENGYVVNEYLEKLFKKISGIIDNSPTLKAIFKDTNNNFFPEGSIIKRPMLAKTLREIVQYKADALYNGSLTENFIKDIQKRGGIITKKDMEDYRAEEQEAVRLELPDNKILYTSPLPGSGIILASILKTFNKFSDLGDLESAETWHKIVESLKFSYAARSNLGDPKFVPGMTDLLRKLISEEHSNEILQRTEKSNVTSNSPEYYNLKTVAPENFGTAHICVLSPEGDAVSFTSSINYYYGAGFVSESTGIILNNHMDDFSTAGKLNSFDLPPSLANYISPLKQPLSSICASIVLDGEKGGVDLLIGGAGGSKITSSVAQVLIRYYWFKESIIGAIAAPRLHHQLYPMVLYAEESFNKEIIEKLKKKQHIVELVPSMGFSALTAISTRGNRIEACSDPRRLGLVAFVDSRQPKK